MCSVSCIIFQDVVELHIDYYEIIILYMFDVGQILWIFVGILCLLFTTVTVAFWENTCSTICKSCILSVYENLPP